MYLGIGEDPKATELSSTAFKRAAQSLLASQQGPFAVVAMSTNLGVRILGQFADRAVATAAFSAAVTFPGDSVFVGLFSHDEDSPSGWWTLESKKIQRYTIDWRYPALAAAVGMSIFWFATSPKQKRRR